MQVYFSIMDKKEANSLNEITLRHKSERFIRIRADERYIRIG